MRKIKFFMEPVTQIKPWLNAMASQGYRLINVKNFIYEFEKTDKKYYYDTQYIGNDSVKKNKEYLEMIDEGGYKTFRAPINQGNVALGKVRIRILANRHGKVATTFGNYGREILIVESEEPVEEVLLTDAADIAEEYRNIRNTYIQGFIIMLILVGITVYNWFMEGPAASNKIVLILTVVLTLYFLSRLIKFQKNYTIYQDESKVQEK